MSKTIWSQFTKNFWNPTLLWSYQSSSLRSHTFNITPSSPWQLKSRPILSNWWKNLPLRRMKSSLSKRVNNIKAKKTTKRQLNKKALTRKVKVMMMKLILIMKKLMRMSLRTTNKLKKVIGTHLSSLYLKKLKNQTLNPTQIIANKPLKHKNKSTKKDSNSTTK